MSIRPLLTIVLLILVITCVVLVSGHLNRTAQSGGLSLAPGSASAASALKSDGLPNRLTGGPPPTAAQRMDKLSARIERASKRIEAASKQ